jgi:hypothetical protein
MHACQMMMPQATTDMSTTSEPDLASILNSDEDFGLEVGQQI